MSQMHDYDYQIKIILIGDACVGKSCLLVRYADDKFPERYTTTIGVDFRFKAEKYNNKCVKIQIWDTAGQERYRSIAKTFYRNGDGIIIVYDVTNKDTFDNIKKWVSEAKTHIEDFDSIPKIAIGNKSDLTSLRMVSDEEIKAKEKEFGMRFVMASAKTAEGVTKAFNIVIEDIMKRNIEQESDVNNKDKAKGKNGNFVKDGMNGVKGVIVDENYHNEKKKMCCG